MAGQLAKQVFRGRTTLLSLAGLLLLSSCDFIDDSFDAQLTEAEAASFVLLDERFPLPEGAKNVWVSSIGIQDTILWVRFDLPDYQAVDFATKYVATGEQEVCGVVDYVPGTIGPEELYCDKTNLAPGCDMSVAEGTPEWWPKDCPDGAMSGSIKLSENYPPRHVLVVPRGDQATVFVKTFDL